MNKRAKRSQKWLIAIAVVTALIWLQSLLPAEQSGAESDAVIALLKMILGEGKAAMWVLTHVRKIAHFVEFAVLGVTWGGFAPDNRFSIKTTEVALDRCRESGIDGFFITMWGDDGGECSPFAVLPSLLYAAEVYRGNTDIDAIKAKFKNLFGLFWDDFMLLDDLDLAGERHRRSSSKQMLYNDPLMGLHDGRITPDMSDYYRDLAARLRQVQADPHGLMFTQYADLAELLSFKATIGIRARAAYTADNREAMAQVLEDYPKLLASLEKFYDTFRRRWMTDNKPFGFEV
jgi:hypothetical protein